MPNRQYVPIIQDPRALAAIPSSQNTQVAPALRIEVLGDGRALCDGVELCLGTSTAGRTALFILMLKSPDRCQREWLIDQLWSDGDVASSRNRLNVALHAVRAPLRAGRVDDVFGLRGSAYEVTWPHPVEVDVREYAGWARIGESLTRLGRLTDAVIHDGFATFMSSRDVLESASAPWLEAERERHRIVRGNTLVRLGMNLVRLDRHQEAVDVAQLSFDQEPWREDTHALVMLAFALSGRPDLAVRQFDRCSSTLRDELGLEPGADLVHLRDDIRSRNDLSGYTALPS